MCYLEGLASLFITYWLCKTYEIPFYYDDYNENFYLYGRAILEFSCSIFWYLGVRLLPMGDALSITMICPICVVFLAAWLLGEKVFINDYFTAIFGFFGVLLIAKPSFIINLIGYQN